MFSLCINNYSVFEKNEINDKTELQIFIVVQTSVHQIKYPNFNTEYCDNVMSKTFSDIRFVFSDQELIRINGFQHLCVEGRLFISTYKITVNFRAQYLGTVMSKSKSDFRFVIRNPELTRLDTFCLP